MQLCYLSLGPFFGGGGEEVMKGYHGHLYIVEFYPSIYYPVNNK